MDCAPLDQPQSVPTVFVSVDALRAAGVHGTPVADITNPLTSDIRRADVP